MTNSFYSKNELSELGLKRFGENVLISKKCSIYGAENISIGSNVRIDDFCILSGKIELQNYIHIAAFSCLFAGDAGIIMKDFSGLSSRCSIYAVSDDYSGEYLTNPMVPLKYRKIKSAAVILEKHVIIGVGSIILPGVTVKEGCALGAMSLLQKSTEAFGIYFGIPAKKIKNRKMDLIELEMRIKKQ